MLIITVGVFVCPWDIKVWRIRTKSKEAKPTSASEPKKKGRTQVFIRDQRTQTESRPGGGDRGTAVSCLLARWGKQGASGPGGEEYSMVWSWSVIREVFVIKQLCGVSALSHIAAKV